MIEAREGDEIIVNVLNSITHEEFKDQGVSIHWHGLTLNGKFFPLKSNTVLVRGNIDWRLAGANAMDGAVGITQRAIKAAESYQYRFKIGDNEAGTYWFVEKPANLISNPIADWHRYHGHSGIQRADGLYGALVVHQSDDSWKSQESPLPETAVLIGDWYHRKSEDVLDWFLDPAHYGYEVSSH